MMKKYILFINLFFCGLCSIAQPVESFLFKGEWGFSVGANQYLGDLNPVGNFNYFQPSFNVYYKKNISKNFGLRFAFEYNKLAYADAYNNADYIEFRERNLSFENQTFGFLAGVEFNFLRYTPGSYNHRFTPYLGLNLGVIYTNPYSFDNLNNQVYLRPLITERLNIDDKSEKYDFITGIAPVTLGLKFNVSTHVNLFAEFSYVFTITDYLDDVSKQYAGIDAFVGQPVSAYFQDRSFNQVYGVKGKERGSGMFLDNYMTGRFGVSFNFLESCCPVPEKIRYY